MRLAATASGWRAGWCHAIASGAKTDRLDAAMLMRVFLGWLRGERGHCGMVEIPTMEEEAARRPSRERESLVNERSRITNRMKIGQATWLLVFLHSHSVSPLEIFLMAISQSPQFPNEQRL
jgi:hypothetical protein